MAGWAVVPDQSAWKPVDEQPTDNRNSMQKSFDENTKTSSDEPLLETGLKSVVSGIGQPLVHPIDTAKSMGRMAMHPLDSAHEEVNELHEHPAYAATKMAGNAFGSMALGAGLGAAPGAIGDAVDAIPTRAKAGRIFEDLNTKLANQPVKMSQSVAPLQRAIEIARGGTLPTAVKGLLERSQSPIDMTFPEARDYQGNLSDLSASDRMAMNKRMGGGVKQLNKGLYGDIRDAADAQGLGEDYDKGMTMYRRASGLNDAARSVGKMALNASKVAVPAALGYGLYKDLK